MTKAERYDGKLVTVRGQFRGANLFGDLPSSSRNRSSDWGLKDDLFAAWVSGKKAKGPSWTLDPDLRRDSGKGLLVTGRVWRGSAFGGTKGRTQLPGLVDRYMKGRVKLDEMVTKELPLSRINEAFELMHHGQVIRSVIRYDL